MWKVMIYNNIWYCAAIAMPRIMLFSVVQLALARLAPKYDSVIVRSCSEVEQPVVFKYIMLKPRQVMDVVCDPFLVSDRSVYIFLNLDHNRQARKPSGQFNCKLWFSLAPSHTCSFQDKPKFDYVPTSLLNISTGLKVSSAKEIITKSRQTSTRRRRFWTTSRSTIWRKGWDFLECVQT